MIILDNIIKWFNTILLHEKNTSKTNKPGGIFRGCSLLTGWVFCVLLMAYTTCAVAADTDEKLLLKKMTALTHAVSDSGINADYLPGMVTVLYGKDLASQGIGSVGEALTRVPGVAVTVDQNGNWNTVVRGLARPFATGQLKLLLNGEPLNTVLGIDLIPNIPIEQIERIEVVRGPASVRYGESAYAGVMNVVTRNSGNAVFAGAGSYDSYLGGAVLSSDYPEKDLKLSLNLSYRTTRRGDLDTGIPGDETNPGTNSPADSSENPGTDTSSSDAMDNGGVPTVSDNDSSDSSSIISNRSLNEKSLLALVFQTGFKGFELEMSHMENGQGDFYTTTQQGITLKKDVRLFPGVRSSLSFGWLGQWAKEDYSPYTQQGTDEPVYLVEYRSETYQGGLDLTVDNFENHEVRVNLFGKKSEPVEVERESSAGREKDSGKSRRLVSLMIQDTWNVTDQLSLICGVRGDDYDDLGSEATPRVAAVYRLNQKQNNRFNHLVKVQAARSVRPQSFLEINDLDEATLDLKKPGMETIDSVEAGYIVKTPWFLGRLTGFVSETRTGKGLDAAEGAEYSSHGVELECEQRLLSDRLRLDSSGSWAHIRDKDTGMAPAGSMEYLARAGASWDMLSWLSLDVRYRFTGKQALESGFAGTTHSTDVTTTLHTFIKGLTLRSGIKNIFEEDVRYPSHLDQDRLIETSLSYPGDYQKPERWWWVRVDYDF